MVNSSKTPFLELQYLEMNKNGRVSYALIVFILASNCFLACLGGQDDKDKGGITEAVFPQATEQIYKNLMNLTELFEGEIGDQLSYCIKNVEADWNGAFNFTSDLTFLTSCWRKTSRDLPQRICTVAEMKFYFMGLIEKGSKTTHYLKPNNNCNLTSWVDGCEPGWACSVGQNQKVDLKNSKVMPARTRDCQVCCEGFFCPHGLTCMIPCPLGAYCPLAKLNKATGICDPYHYQLPPGQPNHTCGGADLWADVLSGSEIFCSAGSFCPTTTEKIPCSKGHYCRMGSTSEKTMNPAATESDSTMNTSVESEKGIDSTMTHTIGSEKTNDSTKQAIIEYDSAMNPFGRESKRLPQPNGEIPMVLKAVRNYGSAVNVKPGVLAADGDSDTKFDAGTT